ncbi:hypothetical protein, partial [Paracoccus sp. AS002]|uniref:hypothetical protein n=1 Tax=Paracoccus sp. AS002 TaxID=3019545 RepID=UPI0023E7FDB1
MYKDLDHLTDGQFITARFTHSKGQANRFVANLAHLRGSVAQIGLRPRFPFPRTDLSHSFR